MIYLAASESQKYLLQSHKSDFLILLRCTKFQDFFAETFSGVILHIPRCRARVNVKKIAASEEQQYQNST